MSWLFSQALVEAFSAATSWDGGPFAQLSVMPSARPFWRNDKPMDFSRFSRFGLTSSFDAGEWRGLVDVVSGGFPCQDISVAGSGDGLDGERSGLWREMARVLRDVGARYAYVENSPALTSRGLHRVLADLAELRFDAQSGVLGASDVGAPHHRKRIWILAHARRGRQRQPLQSQPQRRCRGPADTGRDGTI